MLLRAFNNFANQKTLSFLKLHNISLPNVVTTNTTNPLFFDPRKSTLYIHGLEYCSALIVKPRNRNNGVMAAVHIEALKTDFAIYNIDTVIKNVSKYNNDHELSALIIHRNYLTGTSFDSFTNRNSFLVKDALSTFSNVDVNTDICANSSFFLPFGNSILNVPSLVRYGMNEVLYGNNKLNRPNPFLCDDLSSPSISYNRLIDKNFLVPVNSYSVAKKGSELAVDNLYNCAVGLVRSAEGGHFSLFHVNSFFSREGSQRSISYAISELMVADNVSIDDLLVDIYWRSIASSDCSLVNSIDTIEFLKKSGISTDNITSDCGNRSMVYSSGNRISERPLLDVFSRPSRYIG